MQLSFPHLPIIKPGTSFTSTVIETHNYNPKLPHCLLNQEDCQYGFSRYFIYNNPLKMCNPIKRSFY